MKKTLVVIVLIILFIFVAGIVIIGGRSKTSVSQTTPPSNSPTPTPSSLHSNTTEKWAGTWTNSLGEHGDETLELTNGSNGNFKGVWSGNINVTGQWTDNTDIKFNGQTPTRDYQAQGTITGDTLTIKYTATRLNTSGTYTGEEHLTRTSQ